MGEERNSDASSRCHTLGGGGIKKLNLHPHANQMYAKKKNNPKYIKHDVFRATDILKKNK